jgi:hypothetical protein
MINLQQKSKLKKELRVVAALVQNQFNKKINLLRNLKFSNSQQSILMR